MGWAMVESMCAEIRSLEQGQTRAPDLPPTADNPEQWVDMLSEREAKQLLLVRVISHYRRWDLG